MTSFKIPSGLIFSPGLIDCIFPAHGFFFGGVAFVVDKSYRTFGFGVFGSVFAAVVGFQALFQTVCPSGVKSTVGTLDDVGVIHGAPFWVVR